jgi:hypothetical protein
MATKKVDRAIHGPSWTEVILGAVLSLLLGAVLGAALLVLKPIKQVRELPKEADRDASVVYYVEGSKDTTKARQALAKRKAFVEGQSVSVTEDEINSLVTVKEPPPAAPDPKADKKAKSTDKAGKAVDKAAAAASDMLATGAPNVRIRENVMQIGVPVTVGAMGVDAKVIVFGRGTFAKEGDVFVYQPAELYLGSCPVQRLPFISSYVRNKFLSSALVPEDIATAWKKLANVTVEGNALKLAMQ